ncbi:hypothetical protein CEE37_06460 [candidate division LCP-89 bacterium B3_LCP]|uniref:Secretion system C-terminal sorting domain-containing protein n=1 Tax=candidate division LCP-89 bacterium B3_LCP TaxID=2012998 RepID=A0A532V0D5_UNCL8|nr:MAG: hypothetical protein CEE37_06460 [candidate division LCP-89 bacterium B3_LCP]
MEVKMSSGRYLSIGITACLLLSAGISYAVLVDGYCYLEGQTNHSGTTVLFEENSPGAVTDSTLTDNAGYYQIDLAAGAYDVYFLHEFYYYDYILDQLFFSPTTLPDITLNSYPVGVYISGPLIGTLEDTTYVVTGPISVEAGQSLTISPGATLLFWDFFEYPTFNIYGTLYAEGTEQDSIKFTSVEEAHWGGIDFLTTVSSDSRLEYCEISNSDAGGIYCDNASPTISHCLIYRNTADDGGGINCYLASPTISYCTIKGNTAGNGGGIQCWEASPTIEYCLIDDNTAWDDWGGGGGIFCRDSSEPNVSYCTITENTAPDGGGIRFMSAEGIFNNCTIQANHCWYHGGAIYADDSGFWYPILSNCLIEGNTTGQSGGGCYFVQNSFPTFSYCTITTNQGYGVYTSSGYEPASLYNCTIEGNEDGGVSGWWNVSNCTVTGNHGIGISSSGIVAECTVTGNDGVGISGDGDFYYNLVRDNFGGGMICTGDANIRSCTIVENGGCGINISNANPTILNTVVSGNAQAGVTGYYVNASITYSDFFDNAGGNIMGNHPQWLGQIVTVNTNGDSCDLYYNIFEDPEFVDTIWSDYRLDWDSPCIDAGDPDPLYVDPDGTVADMGAFYFNQLAPVSILLTPMNTPIAIPAGGGSFRYFIRATNIQSTPQTATIWTEAVLPNGSIYGPILGPLSAPLDPDQTAMRQRTQTVPAGAPAGSYSYDAYSVVGSDTSMDSFTFVKLGSDGSDCLDGWIDSGETFGEIAGGNTPTLQQEFTLLGAYPNPFNPTTTIRFNLPKTCLVYLEVFDISGRSVTSLINGWRNAGNHQVTFDASNLPSGVYIHQLSAGDFTATGKMVLVK